MSFSVQFETDSLAFREDPAREVARILDGIAQELRDSEWTSGVCVDRNGSTIGGWNLSE